MDGESANYRAERERNKRIARAEPDSRARQRRDAARDERKAFKACEREGGRGEPDGPGHAGLANSPKCFVAASQ